MKTPVKKPPRNTRGHTYFPLLRRFVTHGAPKDKKAATGAKESDALPGAFVAKEGGIAAHRILTEEGVAVLEWRAFFALPPEPSTQPSKKKQGTARIRALYTRIAKEVFCFVERELYPAEARAYREDRDPHKRFRYARLILSIDCRERARTEDSLLMTRRIKLTRGGKCLWEAEEEELFSQKSGGMLPRPRPKKKKQDKKKAAKSAASP